MHHWLPRITLPMLMAAGVLFALDAPAQVYRPQKELRTIHAGGYELVVQKDGQADILFGGGAPVFDNVHPEVRFGGEEDFEALPVRGRSTARREVHNRLGRGQGMTFMRGPCEWHVDTYPAKPFITAQLFYTNTGKKPVHISALAPWVVGSDGEGALFLGPNAGNAPILDNGRLFSTFNDYAQVRTGEAASQWNIAVHNPAGGRSLIAGFLTSDRGYGELYLNHGGGESFETLRAYCVYDPPVEVAPGETLASEVCYIAIAETDVLLGLDRFGKAMAVWNGVRDERPFIPHGWDSWSTRHYRDISAGIIRENLAVMKDHLKRYGWQCMAIDAGWSLGAPEWEADPAKFPEGMAAMAAEIHEAGIKAALWLDPFTAPRDCTLAAEHPDWFAEPHAVGRVIMGADSLILDVSHPQAYAWAVALASKVGRDWGYDALVEADFVYHLLLADAYHNPKLTRIEVQRLGMQALRQGMGEDRFIMATTPQPVNGVYAQGIRVGRDCVPLWRTGNMQGNWGAADTLTNAIRRFYMSPHLFIPDQDCAFFGMDESYARWKVEDQPRLNDAQTLAWLTGAALTGGAVKIGEPFTDLSPKQIGVLRRLLPSPERPARPIDLFSTEAPQVWHMPFEGPAGEWHIVGVFNWDETGTRQVRIPLGTMGLSPGAYYTVFEYWTQQYHGLAQGFLDIEAQPGSVRLLGLRPYEERPMLLASDINIYQGAMDHVSLQWRPEEGVLTGQFEAIPNTDYVFHWLLPEAYAATAAQSSLEQDAPFQMEGAVCRLQAHAGPAGGPSRWELAVQRREGVRNP